MARLYSSAHFNDNFPQHGDPEVLRTPLEGVALVMKAMGIDKVCFVTDLSPPANGSCSVLAPDSRRRQDNDKSLQA